MRKRSLDMIHALARRDERVVFIGSDLSPNLLGEMKLNKTKLPSGADSPLRGARVADAPNGQLPLVIVAPAMAASRSTRSR